MQKERKLLKLSIVHTVYIEEIEKERRERVKRYSIVFRHVWFIYEKAGGSQFNLTTTHQIVQPNNN